MPRPPDRRMHGPESDRDDLWFTFGYARQPRAIRAMISTHT